MHIIYKFILHNINLYSYALGMYESYNNIENVHNMMYRLGTHGPSTADTAHESLPGA